MLAASAGQWAVGLATIPLLAAAGWFVYAHILRKPERILANARRRLDRGDWQAALMQVRAVQPATGAVAVPWHDTRRMLEGECLTIASEGALKAGRFDEALEHYRQAGELL